MQKYEKKDSVRSRSTVTSRVVELEPPTATLFGWSRSREKGAAPAPGQAPALTCVKKKISQNIEQKCKIN